MADRYDAIVIGLGTMGSAACAELARRGLRVLGLEQFDIPHALGSHHGRSRIFRLAYSEHPDYVPLLRRALAAWEALNAASGLEIFRRTGILYLGAPQSACIAGALDSARRHGLEHEPLDAHALRERYPQFTLPPGFTGVYEPTGGFIVPESAVAAFARLALASGAELRAREPVLEWRAEGSSLRVRTARGEHAADRLVVAGGAWTARLIRGLGVDLVVTRQVAGWVQPRMPALFEHAQPAPTPAFPCWAMAAEDGHLYYGFPILPGWPGFKLARHWRGAPTDPDSVDRSVRPEDEEEFRACLRRYIPAADGPLLAASVCLYTNSPDGHFIIDRHPGHPNVVVACGFSGHGFKFAPVVGEVLADLAMGRAPTGAEFLGLSRFAP